MFKFLFTLALSALTLSLHADTAAFFQSTDQLLQRYVSNGAVDYAGLKSGGALTPLVEEIATVDLNKLSGNERKAYLINAYNLLVIHQVLKNQPLKSVLDVNGFFDTKKQTIGGRRLTLNQLEKDLLLKETGDARLHFVLVCGAVGCPPITDFAYTPDQLDAQLDRQTRKALNDRTFLRDNGSSVELSQIFEWYAADFGGSKTKVLTWINQYRNQPLSTTAKVSYYNYDWSLNGSDARTGALPTGTAPGGAANAARYVVSSTIRQGTFEFKLFNNLYSQDAGGERASFLTSSLSALYGLTDRINVGFDARYRNVRYDASGTASNFDVFSSNGANAFRNGLTGFGPKVRIAPFEKLPNFSVQSAYWFSTADQAAGNSDGLRFLDFDGDTWFTQIFNDFPIGTRFSAFAELDVVLEDIGGINRFSTPVTGIFSFFPNPKTTLYGLASYSPYWQENYDFFYQLGGGAKYQFTPRFELEVLLTAFDNQFIQSVNGSASTVNLGVRWNL